MTESDTRAPYPDLVLVREAHSFAGACLAINTVMAVFKAAVGVLTGSHALLASALYSINDVLSAIAVAVSLRVGNRSADSSHPYGFGKAEFIAAGMVSLTIAIGVIFMFFFSVVDIIRGVPGPPHVVAASLAALSLIVSYTLSKRGHFLGHRLRSPILNICADHHHADAEGSLLAIIGIGGAVLGYHTLDRVIAVFETVHLIAISGKLLARSVKGLMDTALPDEEVDLITSACGKVPGVGAVAHVWSRQTGRKTWVDVAVKVSEQLNVNQAHRVCRSVESVVRGVLGTGVVTQVRFQGAQAEYATPPAGGSPHG